MRKIVKLLSISMALSLLLGSTHAEAASSINKYTVDDARFGEAYKLTEEEKQELFGTVIVEELEDIGVSEKSETRMLIEKFVDENPEAVANLLRNWLNDDWS